MIRRSAIALAACAAAAIAFAGCGGGGGGGETDQLASLAPANVPFYLESVVRPEGEQRDAIDSLASRVGGIEDPGEAIPGQLDASLTAFNATYDDDIAPWLGERAALFLQSYSSTPGFAVAFETTDTDKAQDFLDKAAESSNGAKKSTYNGVEYFQASGEDGAFGAGVIGDSLVFGTLGAFKAAVDASNGSSLADSGAFTNGTSMLPSDNLALGYADGQKAAEHLGSLSTDPLQAAVLSSALQSLANGAATFALSATPDTASLDLSVQSSVALAGGDLVGRAPADSWLAIGVQNLGGILGSALAAADTLRLTSLTDEIRHLTGVDPKDAASWVRSGYASVAGTSEKDIHIGAVVGTSDPKESAKEIGAAKRRVQADADAKVSGPRVKGADTGFSATAPESPQAIDVAQVGEQVVAALGPGRPGQGELTPKQPLSRDPTFKSALDALGSEVSPLAFVSLPHFLVVAERGGSANDPDYVAAEPYLRKLSYLLAGTSSAAGRTTVRFVVGVK